MGANLSTPGVFVTGTDTAVGKTLVAAALVRLLVSRGHRVVGLKPVASGATGPAGELRNDDALALAAESSPQLPYELTNPFCFEAAVAPHLAARDSGACVSVEALLAWYARASAGAELAVVEGAGGWRVPLQRETFLSDLPERLGLGVIMVVGLRLGCLNHARLTWEAIRQGGRCPFLGWIGNDLVEPFERRRENLETLTDLLGDPPLALLPRLARAEASAAVKALDSRRLDTQLRPLLSRKDD